MYLVLAVQGLRCCEPFSIAVARGPLSTSGARASHFTASLVAGRGSGARGLRSCSARALERRLSSCCERTQLLRDMWDLPGSGLTLSPALVGGFFSTEPAGEPCQVIFAYTKL